MKVISLLAQKGGVGKTTLTLHWAVEAERQGMGSVAVIDTDRQRSAIKWFERRGEDSPLMLQANENNLADAIEACKENGVDLVLVDSMPHAGTSSLVAARMADLAVIPCGHSVLDIEAIGDTISIINRAKTPGVIVVNRGRHHSRITEQAADLLKDYGLPVCPTRIMRWAALEDAFIDGRAVAEVEPNSKAAHQITDSWEWILKQLKRT